MSLSITPSLRFLHGANSHLEEVRDADKLLKLALKIAREAFEADEVCLAMPRFGAKDATIYASIPGGTAWTKEHFAEFLRGRRPRLGATRVYALIERRGRPWAVLALRNRRRSFGKDAVREASRMGNIISRLLRRIDDARIVDVRARVDRKMMEQLRPLDLFYQVLHGLRTLTHYDHSAAVLIHEKGSAHLEVAAEQISWRKGRSHRIGRLLEISDEARRELRRGEVLGFDRSRGRWNEWNGREDARSLAALAADDRDDSVEALSVLVAPLTTREQYLGVLVVAACTPGSLAAYEASLVQRFLPVAAVAIRNMGRATSLEEGMLEAERKNAFATLARGVSHDVNNAFGSVLPLVQQMIEEARNGAIDPELFARDLEQVEASLQVCRRIFGGMLSFARNAAHSVGEGDVCQALEGMKAVLDESLRRAGIELVVRTPGGLPRVRGTQADLEQLILNLATNARDAMSTGGKLVIEASLGAEFVEVGISDTGAGIPPEHMPRIKEPFFTTKSQGNGLGLSICRAIVWRMRGEMAIESEPGVGTRVNLRLPLTAEDALPRVESPAEGTAKAEVER